MANVDVADEHDSDKKREATSCGRAAERDRTDQTEDLLIIGPAAAAAAAAAAQASFVSSNHVRRKRSHRQTDRQTGVDGFVYLWLTGATAV